MGKKITNPGYRASLFKWSTSKRIIVLRARELNRIDDSNIWVACYRPDGQWHVIRHDLLPPDVVDVVKGE